VLEAGGFFGESGLFEKESVRPATARAVGDTCVLSIEKKAFLDRIHEDPSFVIKMLRTMSRRIRELEAMLVSTADVQSGAAGKEPVPDDTKVA